MKIYKIYQNVGSTRLSERGGSARLAERAVLVLGPLSAVLCEIRGKSLLSQRCLFGSSVEADLFSL